MSSERLCSRHRVRTQPPGVVLVLLGLVFMLTGCGYQFRVQGTGPTIQAEEASPTPKGPIPRLVIHNFKNEAYEPNLELKYTEYTKDEFEAGSGALVVNRGEPSDLVLSGEILSIAMPALSFTRQTTLESRVTVTVQAVIKDARTNQIVWKQTATASGEYFITDNLQFNRVLQTRALEQAGKLIAQDLATRFLADRISGRFPPSRGKATPTSSTSSKPSDPASEATEPTGSGIEAQP